VTRRELVKKFQAELVIIVACSPSILDVPANCHNPLLVLQYTGEMRLVARNKKGSWCDLGPVLTATRQQVVESCEYRVADALQWAGMARVPEPAEPEPPEPMQESELAQVLARVGQKESELACMLAEEHERWRRRQGLDPLPEAEEVLRHARGRAS